MKFDFEDDLIDFIEVERTWEEITSKFPEHSLNAISICLRQLEERRQIKVHVKYHASFHSTPKTNPTRATNSPPLHNRT